MKYHVVDRMNTVRIFFNIIFLSMIVMLPACWSTQEKSSVKKESSLSSMFWISSPMMIAI